MAVLTIQVVSRRSGLSETDVALVPHPAVQGYLHWWHPTA